MTTTSKKLPLSLCIDQGGHASRAIIYDIRGQVVAVGSYLIDTHHPNPEWVEHEAEEMVRSIQISVDQALRQLGERAHLIKVAGLATQRSSIVCWDKKTGAALSPIISWQDRRAAAWLEQFKAHDALIRNKTGLVTSAHYGASKLRWCLDHYSEVKTALSEGTLAMGPLASFLCFRLLKEHPLVIDPANASRTLLWNYRTGDWDQELLDLFGIPAAVLPRCVPTRHAYGHLMTRVKAVPMRCVTGDQSAALFAFGLPKSETLYVNMGTGVFLQRPLPSPPSTDLNLLCSIACRDETTCYVLEGTVNGAGSALLWVEKTFGIDAAEAENGLPEWLETVQNPPIFLNGVSGLGSPFWVPEFNSRFLSEGNTAEKLVGVIESIVFLIYVNIAIMARVHKPPQHIVVTGGLSQLDGLCQRLADLSGMLVFRSPYSEATARGTAWLIAQDTDTWQEMQEQNELFSPQPNLNLLQRYHLWMSGMSEAMIKNVAKPVLNVE